MALVGYSDSEDSDADTAQPTAPIAPKRIERSEGNKIKVDLTSLQHASQAEPAEPSAKRQRTAGAFSGFNSLLPAPKRTAQSSIKPGVSLRTSSEAAFSRVPPPKLPSSLEDGDEAISVIKTTAAETTDVEPTLVGKPTRFMPLSVANSKKKKKRPPLPVTAPEQNAGMGEAITVADIKPDHKAKQSLFSISEQETPSTTASSTLYEPEFVKPAMQTRLTYTHGDYAPATIAQDTGLHGVATDLALSESDRRRLFGRSGGQANVNITHFDMNAEYQSNQALAARGEVVEHRAVRAIAPGRHSLQQLVSNVQSQSEAIEDKWAEGRRARGETGNKYGW